MTTAQQIADALAAAYATNRPAVTAAFEAALAERVELVHLPAQPQDGVYDRSLLVAAQAAQAERIAAIIKDFREVVTTSATADEVTVTLSISGTLPNGTPIAINGTDVLTVADGRVHRMLSMVESEQWDALLAALTAR
jgi:ketosteroid isomerase-like protein